jgi:hypothetical protein
MHSSVLLAETLVALGVLAAPYSAAARCRLQVKLASGSAFTRSAKCTDGEASCDNDFNADRTCDFRASLCFSANSVACDSTDLATMSIASAPGLGGISTVLENFKTSAAPGALCTEPATVPVALGTKKKAQLAMKVLGTHGSQRFAFVCQRAKGTKPPTGATFAKDIQKKIFDTTCATQFCHGASAASAGLDLSEGAAYTNLVNVPAANEAAKAAGLVRVLPSDPADSFLLQKLSGTLGAGEGVPMPLVGGPLPASDIDTIRRWIAAGAPETAPF